MKKIFICCLLMAASLPALAQYSSPESAIFDEVGNRWIISNAGNGRILERNAAGVVGNFATNLGGPKGLAIVGDTLYVADVTRLRAYRLTTRAALYTVNVANSTFLNDLAADDEYLYVTDMVRHKISRMDLGSHQVEAYVTQGITSPNGLFFDREHNRLILVSQRANSPIQEVDLEDGSVAVIVETQLSNLDGIARDGNGNYYISSWGTNAVYLFRNDFSGQTILEDSLEGPADIFYNLRDNVLAIPCMSVHRVIFRNTPPPQAQLRTPNSVDFGDVQTFTRLEHAVVWQNSGGEDIVIDSVRHSGEGFTVAIEAGLRLEPGESIDVAVAFEPIDSVEYIDTVSIYSSEPMSPRWMILGGLGIAAPDLVVPASHDFGRFRPGEEAGWDVELRNEGLATLTLDSVRVRRGGGFTARLPNRRELQPGESENATVTFSPFARGEFGDTVFFYSNDPTSPASVVVTGLGVEPASLHIGNELDFGNTAIGDTSRLTVMWQNEGDDTLRIDSLVQEIGYFSVAPPDPPWIAPQDTVTSDFRFIPTGDNGRRWDTVRIYSNDFFSPEIVTLRGNVTGASVPGEAPLPLEFTMSEAHPSPFNSRTYFTLSLPMSVSARIDLYDAQGRMVQEVLNAGLEAGIHLLTLDGNGLPAGTFFLRGSAGDFTFSRSIVYLK